MKYGKNISVVYVVPTLVYFLLTLEASSTQIGLEQAIEQQLNKEAMMQHLSSDSLPFEQGDNQSLKRKRRYLEFPEGSSFQLVYDLIIGVVDFTNYLILGVTVALAWELPSKPPSEILDDLNERLKDGTLGTSRNDTAENIKYVDLNFKSTANRPKYSLQPMARPPMHYQYYTPLRLNSYAPNQYRNWSREPNMFYTPKQKHPFAKWTQNKNLDKLSTKEYKYPWWNLRQRLNNSLTSHPSIRRFDNNLKYSRVYSDKKVPIRTYATYPRTGRFEHRIFPVFGKRSISARQTQGDNASNAKFGSMRDGIAAELPSKLDRIHIEHHRRTRHELYQRIETYLNGRGSHGHHCVLRALCETGQKSNEHKPGSFVGELMRAIFTMPEPLGASTDGNQHSGYKQLRYDAAHALKEDCATRYNHCKESLWASHFVL